MRGGGRLAGRQLDASWTLDPTLSRATRSFILRARHPQRPRHFEQAADQPRRPRRRARRLRRPFRSADRILDDEALVAAKAILNQDNPAPTGESLKATYERYSQLLARDLVQQRFEGLGQATPEMILDLDLNMGERIGPR